MKTLYKNESNDMTTIIFEKEENEYVVSITSSFINVNFDTKEESKDFSEDQLDVVKEQIKRLVRVKNTELEVDLQDRLFDLLTQDM